MNTISSISQVPYRVPGGVSRADLFMVQMFWGAPLFTPGIVYYKGDLAKPSIDNGHFYEVTSAGVADFIEPEWSTGFVKTGTVTFRSVPYDLFLFPGEEIADSVWTIDSPEAILTDALVYGTSTRVMVNLSAVPLIITEIQITNKITKANSESLAKTLRFQLREVAND